MRIKLSLVIIAFAYGQLFSAHFAYKEYVYVTNAFFISLCPLISINMDLGINAARIGNGIPYLYYHRGLQADVIKALRKNGISAVPDMTNSDFQIVHNFEYVSEVEDFLKSERDIFKMKYTIVPIIDSSIFRSAADGIRNSFEATVNIRICTFTSSSTLMELGRFQLREKFFLDTSKDYATTSKTLMNVSQKLSKQLILSADWKKIIRSPGFSNYTKKNALDLTSLYQSNGTGNAHFLFSSGILKEKYPIARLYKVNFFTRQKRVSDLENDVIRFDFAKEVPISLTGYILLPNNDLLYLSENNLKVEGAPYRQTSNTFDYKSIATINLAGLQPGSIVTYCIVFVDLYLVTKHLNPRFKPAAYPLAQDFELTQTHKNDTWLFRTSLPLSDSLYFLVNDSSNVKIITDHFASQRIWTLLGKGTIEENYYPRFLRISTVASYKHLYRSMSDSTYSKLSISKPVAYKKPLSKDQITSEIFKTIDFLHDSVRYFNIAYGPKAYIPEPEDSVLKNRQSDCKSNSVVVMNKLHKLGVFAVPALVHSYKKDLVNRKYPSYDATDHMIVYSPDLDWWIDPTYGKSPQWMIPAYLNGSSAILFYRDSITVKTIPYNSGDLYIDTTYYTFEINNKDMNCTVKKYMSYHETFYFQNWLESIEKADRIKAVIDNSLTIDSNKISHRQFTFKTLSGDKKRAILMKSYKLINVNRVIGNNILVKWPETPVDPYDFINNETDTSEINNSGNGYEMTIFITLKTNKKINWKELPAFNSDVFGLKILKKDASHLNLRLYVKSGKIKGKAISTYYKMQNAIGEFFNEEIVLN